MGADKKVRSVSDYLSELAPDRKRAITAIRKGIRKYLPIKSISPKKFIASYEASRGRTG